MRRLPVAPGDRSVTWRDVFPRTWHLKPVKHACSINRGVLPETTDPHTEFRYLDIGSVDSEGNWSASEPMRFGDAPSRARRIVANGDVLVSTVRTYLRAVAHVDKVDEPLICSTGFAVLSANRAVHSKFLAYWARSVYFIDEVVARSVGVSYPAVNASDVGNIPCPLLPLDEQRAITRFLDRETARIDVLIEKKRRQIELLHEKRAALISHVVTKGLDPSARMKDSCVEWLGRVPKHWHVVRLGYFARVRNGSTPSRIYADYWTDGVVPWLSSSKVNEDVITEPSEWITETARRESGLEIMPSGSVVIGLVGQGRTRGMSALMGVSAAINQNMAGITPGNRLVGRYLHYLLKHMYEPIREGGRGANQPALNCELIADLRVLLPPVGEQRAIAEHLDQVSESLSTLSAKIDTTIDRLREYRIALISAAVTGKIDVRREVA